MAAKKRSGGKKKVTIEIDVDTLKALADAADALSELAAAAVWAVDDPAIRRSLTKKRKGGPKRR